MPSTKRRINLTVPEDIYVQLRNYMAENGLVNDATACLQLIVQQIRAQENAKIIMSYLQNTSLEQLQNAASEGAVQAKELFDKAPRK